jgi:hypothetical protein
MAWFPPRNSGHPRIAGTFDFDSTRSARPIRAGIAMSHQVRRLKDHLAATLPPNDPARLLAEGLADDADGVTIAVTCSAIVRSLAARRQEGP